MEVTYHAGLPVATWTEGASRREIPLLDAKFTVDYREKLTENRDDDSDKHHVRIKEQYGTEHIAPITRGERLEPKMADP